MAQIFLEVFSSVSPCRSSVLFESHHLCLHSVFIEHSLFAWPLRGSGAIGVNETQKEESARVYLAFWKWGTGIEQWLNMG